MEKSKILNDAYVGIENFRNKLGETFVDAYMEDSNSSYEISKSIIAVFDNCKTEREFEMADRMLIAVCGYSIESLIDQIKGRDASGYVWVSC